MSLQIELHVVGASGGEIRLRALLFNSGFAPLAVSRNAFVGPNVTDLSPGAPRPASVEPTFGGPEEPLTLQPFTFYGRERTFDGVADGATMEAHYRPEGAAAISASRPISPGSDR